MGLSRYLESSAKFLKEVAEELGYPEDNEMALRVVRSVFIALRDRLTIEESFDLLAHLPILLKGIYVDSWQPSKHRPKVKDFEELMLEVMRADRSSAAIDFGMDELSITETIQCVFRVLKRHLPEGEVSDITANLPNKIKDQWAQA